MSALHKISIIPLSLFHLPTIIKKLLLVMHGLVWYSSVMLCSTRAVYFLLVFFFMLGGLLNCTSSFVVKENFIITISEDHKWKIHTPWWETIWPYINNFLNRNIIITYKVCLFYIMTKKNRDLKLIGCVLITSSSLKLLKVAETVLGANLDQGWNYLYTLY